jgi:two-component system, NarL family, response regulator LiaR
MLENKGLLKVFIVDDHVIVRKGLETLLEDAENCQLVGQASNGIEALHLCASLQPDVVLVDLMMPEMDGVATIRKLRAAHPHLQMIALTSYIDQSLVHSALEAGANGYLLKNVTTRELLDAIQAVSIGQPALSPEAARVLINSTTRPLSVGHDLTEREHEVLLLLVEGLNNAQIADRLSISPFTVKNHVSNILSKLDVATRTEAVSMALQKHIVPVA